MVVLTLGQVLACIVLVAFVVLVAIGEHFLHPFLWGRSPDRPTVRSTRMRLTFRVSLLLATVLFLVAIVASLPDDVMLWLIGASALVIFSMNVWAKSE